MQNDIANLPPHLQSQIAEAGRTIEANTVRVESVNSESGPPTDWTKKPGQDKLPEPARVDPIQQENEQPKR